MNSLSWLIYLSDIVKGLGFFAGLTGFSLAVAGAVSSGPILLEGATRYLKYSVGGVAAGLLMMLVGALVPSKEAVLMIAASEMGETVIKTPEAQEVFSDLRAILKKQLDQMKK